MSPCVENDTRALRLSRTAGAKTVFFAACFRTSSVRPRRGRFRNNRSVQRGAVRNGLIMKEAGEKEKRFPLRNDGRLFVEARVFSPGCFPSDRSGVRKSGERAEKSEAT